MMRQRNLTLICVFLLAAAVVGTASADHFLVVAYDTSAATAIETALTAGGHTFTRMTTAEAVVLTPEEVRTNYNATLWMGNLLSSYHAWAIALMDFGGNLLVADNDFGYSNNTFAIYTAYFEATYHSDDPGLNQLTGQGIMAGINPDITSDSYPDDFAISGTNGTVIFTYDTSSYAAGTAIERTPAAATYRGIYLAWDYDETDSATIQPLTNAIVGYLSQALVPVELMNFTIE